MKVIALLFFAPCAIWAAAPDDAKNIAVTNEKKEEDNTPNVTKSNVTGNFNPDRTEAWGDVELVGGGQVRYKNLFLAHHPNLPYSCMYRQNSYQRYSAGMGIHQGHIRQGCSLPPKKITICRARGWLSLLFPSLAVLISRQCIVDTTR